ncbi:tRNA glutamyl-Q(34) synthetase GluQRS [Enemella sp. A6]|uniref:tRNA glutamyl-Q(34) synthetase GluQRS n=1 Tax=Enemella sp. A6 TaxID=3440152 RepID=UPI003EBE4730
MTSPTNSTTAGAGRYAPSPTSPLHLGNLRTALVAWLLARSTGRAFRLRIEDLDQQRVAGAPAVAAQQVEDLAAIGLDFDPPTVVQTERLAVYEQALERLDVFECFCTRKDIALASTAPHAADGLRPYPGTCRNLDEAERRRRRRERPPALRVRAEGARFTITDRWHGRVGAVVDDFVVRRSDGAFGYHLAVVVDDLAMGIDQVCRGDDLLSSAPRHGWLADRLGGPVPEFAHVPLVVNDEGKRLAKRDGAITLAEVAERGWTPGRVRSLLAASLGLAEPGPDGPDGVHPGEQVGTDELLRRFDPAVMPDQPWVLPRLAVIDPA